MAKVIHFGTPEQRSYSHGDLWVTDPKANQIDRITPGGTITEFTDRGGTSPHRITAGPDGDMWFTDFRGDKVARITPSGMITQFPVPTPASEPASITTGLDGNIWITEYNASKIARLDIRQQ